MVSRSWFNSYGLQTSKTLATGGSSIIPDLPASALPITSPRIQTAVTPDRFAHLLHNNFESNQQQSSKHLMVAGSTETALHYKTKKEKV